MKTILVYDGSLQGFLTAVYEVFERNIKSVSILRQKHLTPEIFNDIQEVVTDSEKARRVWESLKLKAGKERVKEMYLTHLSEFKGAEDIMLGFIVHVYASEHFDKNDQTNIYANRIHQAANIVNRQIQRMKEFISFQLGRDGVYWATVSPDYNILPVLSEHFVKTFDEQRWVIYDEKRSYGIYYDTEKCLQISAPVFRSINQKEEHLLPVNIPEAKTTNGIPGMIRPEA
ncbi:TIGR03915 family putative DNA repair protein [Robertkochia solimangrovi]|uniref:TIGR03915 family putative DNA repair protein n=1 Tax=Robertkochia solimangrovi TaxID=2213046 RepID=UPI00117C2ACB|nr:TIGR03915 family putative DNA repair protein [Robertkochia solimangrovi]TRZ43215.1 DNA metabolism protein [Robertkochia solimangrovi]